MHILKREIALYKKLAGSGIRTRLFTYGDEKDLEYLNCLGDNITPVPMFRSRTEGKWKRFFTQRVATNYLLFSEGIVRQAGRFSVQERVLIVGLTVAPDRRKHSRR